MGTGVHRAHICLLPGEDLTKAAFLSPDTEEATEMARLCFNHFNFEIGGLVGGTYSLGAENVS